MAGENGFQKRRESRKKRQYGYRQPKANSYLIVTEGSKTEPLYLQGIVNLIQAKMGGNVEIVELPVIDISGIGRATRKLVEKTDEIVSKAKIIYQNIWVVFDKDDFGDFDEAIEMAEERGYKVAWTNQAFEYWLYLHFKYSARALHRKEWFSRLSKIFKEKNLGSRVYKKNYPNIYELVNTDDGVNRAIRNAKRRMEKYKKASMPPSSFNPGTTMHLLVEELQKYLTE
ncbi:RloB domain-containing protein [Clostridiales bacterium COT073_COT-073]|nr:RloB domain-containing protein [Clostridiales bacterium COT073_COT-073]